MKKTFIMPTGEKVTHEIPDWKTPWNHDTNFESERTATYTPEPSLTKQEFKEEQDINTILERFTRTKEPPPVALAEDFADLTGRTTYFEMSQRVAEANAAFYELPAPKRAEFLNDPTRWADAVVQATDLGDRKRLKELGIDVPPEKPQEPLQADPPSVATPDRKSDLKPPEAPKGDPKKSDPPK